MFRNLSKILPLLVYPLGLACLLIVLAFVIQLSRWQRGVLALAFLALFLGGNRWITQWLAKSLEWRYFPPRGTVNADVIIVLASGTHAAEFPRSIPEVGEVGDRLIYAAYLYQQGAAPLILHSGEAIDSTDVPGGDIPFLLGLMGVPREAVLLETDSHDTYENAVACRKILKERGFQRVILVTSAAHMPRAVGVFKRLGIEVIPAPTGYTATQWDVGINFHKAPATLLESLLPSADNLKTTTRMLKEYLGIFTYKLRGWY
jgi:uncharacterized SAM-binding protein YcdF (DUF218 family)